MTQDEFKFLQALMQRRAGIVLWSEKQYLAELRLAALAPALGCQGAEEVVARARQGDRELELKVVEALTTSETSFFRDIRPFEQFEGVMLPALTKAREPVRRLRIWCSAVASGQEAYSLAMILARHRSELAGWCIEIVGSDLSRAMVARAVAGRYTHFEVQRGLPVRELVEHFRRDDDGWFVSQALRDAVDFRVVNLMEDLLPPGPFDVVFCRNVLIYFDQPTKSSVLTRVARTLAGDGYLVLGATESVVGLNSGLAPDPANRGLYLHEHAPSLQPA